MFIAAQVSLYPLRQNRFSPTISRATAILKQHGLNVEPGSMSSVVSGEDEALFDGLKEAFQQITAEGEVVMLTAFSNACPVKR